MSPCCPGGHRPSCQWGLTWSHSAQQSLPFSTSGKAIEPPSPHLATAQCPGAQESGQPGPTAKAPFFGPGHGREGLDGAGPSGSGTAWGGGRALSPLRAKSLFGDAKGPFLSHVPGISMERGRPGRRAAGIPSPETPPPLGPLHHARSLPSTGVGLRRATILTHSGYIFNFCNRTGTLA